MRNTILGDGINILLPLDGGEASMRALDEGIYLTKKLGGELRLLHVISTEKEGGIFHWHDSNNFASVEGTEIRDQESLKILDEHRMKLENSGIKYILQNESGDVSDAIKRVVSRDSISLIILGSRAPISHSIPRKLITESSVPILVIK